MAFVTCNTPGCVNEGIPMELTLDFIDPFTGQEVSFSEVQCVCRQVTADISDQTPDVPHYLEDGTLVDPTSPPDQPRPPRPSTGPS